MKRLCIVLWTLSFAAGLFAQNSAESSQAPFALRFERSRSFGEDVDCLIVLPDGHYRRENVFVKWDYSSRLATRKESTTAYIYEGQLSPEEMNQLSVIINTTEFRAIREPERLPMSSEFLSAFIVRARESSAQKFHIGNSSSNYKPHTTEVKPLFAWWNSLEKRKHDLVKGGEPSGCKLPQRISFGAGPASSSNSEPN